MSWITIDATRDELYHAVWNEPVETVAKRLGLSDVGLSKLCRPHNIPTPPRGYWARKTAGTHDPIPPLPVDHFGPALITIAKWKESATTAAVGGIRQSGRSRGN